MDNKISEENKDTNLKKENKEDNQNKNDKKELKNEIIETKEIENNSETNDAKAEGNIKTMEYDVPFYSNEIKKVYHISSEIIPQITLIKTNTKKSSPINRCYLTAEFSPKNNSIICIGGCDEKCNQYDKITEYDLSKNVWNYWECDDQSELGFELSGHSSNLIMVKKQGGITLC